MFGAVWLKLNNICYADVELIFPSEWDTVSESSPALQPEYDDMDEETEVVLEELAESAKPTPVHTGNSFAGLSLINFTGAII